MVDFVKDILLSKKEDDYYLSITPYTGPVNVNKSFTYKNALPYIIKTDKYFLKVELSYYLRTTDEYNMQNDNTRKKITQAYLYTKLKIGGYSFIGYQFNPTWIPTINDDNPNHSFMMILWDASTTKDLAPVYTDISDKWGTLQIMQGNNDNSISGIPYVISLNDIDGGELTFDIMDFQAYDGSTNVTQFVKEIRIKDVKFTLVDSNGDTIENNDIEYIGYLDSSYKDSGKEITLLQGTNTDNIPVERGSLMGFTNGFYFFIQKWIREGATDCIENLLLRSIISNYTDKSIELNPIINFLPSTFGCLTYENFFSGKKFMIMQCDHDFEACKSSIRIQEVSIDNHVVIKTYH